MLLEHRQEYTARCPGCHADALFTAVAGPGPEVERQVELGHILPTQVLPKVIKRVEVDCAGCDNV